MTTSPVLHSVSAATRERGSWARMASRTESEIWSETLSGWPSETDSEVNRNSLFIRSSPRCSAAPYSSKATAPADALRLLFRLLARLPLGMNHAVGAFLGRLVFAFPGRYRTRVLENLGASGLEHGPEELG